MSKHKAEEILGKFSDVSHEMGYYSRSKSPWAKRQSRNLEGKRDRLRKQLLTALCADSNAALLEALIDARSALQSLPADALGMVHAKEDRYEWPIRDELVAKIDRAIAAEEANRCQLAESGN